MTSAIRITLLLVVLSTAMVASGQTSSELRAKYGVPQMVELETDQPDAERFLVRPAIHLTIRYNSAEEPCAALLEPVPNSTPKTLRIESRPELNLMMTSEVIKVIDELLPPETRGKKISQISFNGGDPQMKLHHPGCTGLYFVSFEHAMVNVTSWCQGGTFNATIHWRKSSCRGQTIRPKSDKL